MKRASGFTLIELLVTIAVAMILATVAIPDFQRMMAASRVSSEYNEVLFGLNYARSEAIKRREDVTFTVTQATPWRYGVVDGSVLRQRSGEGTRTALSEGFSVTFGPLGKPTGGCASGCTLFLSNTYSDVRIRAISISPMGRVGEA